MDEIDKFKKKLIRSVVHLRLQLELPYEDVWKQLKEKTGRECETLWKRMCAITTKKMSRLLAAEDVRARVSPGARMTSADWLLFDLMLVHEKPDVITLPTPASEKGAEPQPQSESPALRRLFQLVNNHEIEDCSSFTRTRRWAQLIAEYNTEGRECSPLLLQLRWYQLKERARNSFYEFWHLYRGNRANLPAAVGRSPRPLDVDIARMFSKIVTKPFPEWRELVSSQEVVMPDIFQKFARRARDLPQLYNRDVFITRTSTQPIAAAPVDTEPDLVLVEPKIDTIELVDSDVEDTEEQTDNNDEQQNEESDMTIEPNMTLVGIAGSLEEDGLSNVQIVEATHIPAEELDEEQPSDSIEGNESSPLNDNAERMDISEIDPEPEDSNMWEPNDVKNVESPEEPDVEQVLKEKLNAIIEEEQASVKSITLSDQPDVEQVIKEKLNAILKETESQSMHASDQPDIEQVLKEKLDAVIGEKHGSVRDQRPEQPEMAEQVLRETLETILEETQTVARDEDSDENDTLFTRNYNAEVHLQDLVSKIKEEISDGKQKEESMEGLSSLVIGELPSSLELIDDGIDFIEDSDDDSMTGGAYNNVQKEAQDDAQPKFDLKLMMLPLVYTTKLQLMKCLKNANYETVDTTDIIDSIVAESKPVSALSVNIKNEVVVEEPPEAVTDKNMSDDLIKISDFSHDVPQVAPVINRSEDLVQEDAPNSVGLENDSDSSDDGIPESKRVKLTSGLFRKPRGRTYDPIKLCKNPDFNTRLRRLSARFLTYEWNRIYLNRLKPLTIDLHKSFEQKLIGGTIYLVRDLNAPKLVSNKLKRSVASSVLPTAIPAQCLLDNAKNCENSKIVDLELAQRKNKVIELPDIAKVRRINQHLLTAEVSPIQAAKQVLEVPPLIYTSENGNEARLSNEGSTPSQAMPQTSKDNHPLLEVPKAGEITKVKVELIDNDDDQEKKHGKTLKSDGVSKPEHSRKGTQGHNSVPEKKQYLKRPKVPWYMKSLAHNNAYFEIRDPTGPVKVPWYRTNPYKNDMTQNLLTPDALNKMIGIIAGRAEKEYKKKVKKSAAPVEKTTTKPVQGPDNVSVKEPCTIDLSANECMQTIKPVQGPDNVSVKEPCTIDLSTNECMQSIEEIKEENDVEAIVDNFPQKTCKTRVQHKKPTYCCWANRVIAITARRQRGRSKKTWLPKHKCLQECTCCCRHDMHKMSEKLDLQHLLHPNDPLTCCWASKMIKIFKDRKKYESLKSMPLHSCLLGGKTECKCCCKDSLDTVAGVVKEICQNVKESEERDETANAVYLINTPLSETALHRSVPAVTVVNDGIVPYKDVLDTLNLGTTAEFSSNTSEIDTQRTDEAKTLSETIDVDSNNKASVDHITRVPLNTAAAETVANPQYVIDLEANPNRSTESTSRPYKTSTYSDQLIVLSDDETNAHKESNNGGSYSVPCNAKADASPLPVSTKSVVIQPTPKFIIKCFRNFLRACPVKLGPNKILLTTAKIPADILLPHTKVSAPTPSMPSPFMTNVQLPKGVHFIMDSNGSLSCVIEPGINLDAKTVLEVKNVLNIVQEQLNNKLPVSVATPVDNTITVLSDDDESSVNKPAEPSTSENQEVIDSVALESSASAQAEKDTPQEMDTQDEWEKTATGEDKQDGEDNKVGEDNSINAELTTEVTENVLDVPLPQTTETTSNIASVTQRVDEVPKNSADDIRPVEEVSEVKSGDTEMKTLESITENIGNIKTVEEKVETEDIIETKGKENENEEKSPSEEHKECDQRPATEHIKQNETPSINENTTQPDSEITTEMSEPDNNSPPSDINEITELDTEEHNQEKIQAQPSVSSKKSILSDLMEMSGISSEDILPSVEDNPPVEVTPLIGTTPLMGVTPPAEAPPCPMIEVPQNPHGPVELTHVTNVAALKFAVAAQAKFYRYTLGTGALAAIEVALQSCRRQPPAPPVPHLAPDPLPTLAPLLQAPNTRGSGRPIIIKKVTGSTPPVLTITPPNRRSLLRGPIVTTPVVERRKRGRPRKQVLETTVYNLDATDGEMEEEYLRDSELEDDFGDPRRTISLLKTMLATERAKQAAMKRKRDSSSEDEEPLAKLVKRRRREKKMKKKYKLAKKQLKWLQKAAAMDKIKEAESVSQAADHDVQPVLVDAEPALENAEPALENAETLLEDAESVLEDAESVLQDAAPLPEDIEPVPESIAADLNDEEQCYLDQSGDESENFILGA